MRPKNKPDATKPAWLRALLRQSISLQSCFLRNFSLSRHDLGGKLRPLVWVGLAAYARINARFQLDATAAHRGLAAPIGLNAAASAAIDPAPVERLAHQDAGEAHTAGVVGNGPFKFLPAHNSLPFSWAQRTGSFACLRWLHCPQSSSMFVMLLSPPLARATRWSR